MQIRLARPDDIAILSEYWYDQMVIWQQSSARLRLSPAARAEWEQATYGYLQQVDAFFLVAETAQEVVGGIIGEITPNEPGFAPPQIGVVRALIVDNHSERGHGAGRMLLDAWLGAMRERGIEQLQVRIPAQAAVQQAFWRAVGGANVMDVFWMEI